jgi:hypothetical protein
LSADKNARRWPDKFLRRQKFSRGRFLPRTQMKFVGAGVSERFHSRQESNAGAIFVSRQKCEAVARQIFATAEI